MALAPLDLLPGTIPSDALLLGLLATLGAILLMNRGNRWFVNILALDEPILVGLGAMVIFVAWSGWFDTVFNSVLSSMMGIAIPSVVWWALGAGIAALGLGAFFSDDLDISGFIG